MVAVISGDGLGAYDHSLNLLGSNNNQVGRFGNQLFVNSVTGNLVVQQQDEYLASLGLDTGLIRTYNSFGKFDDENGDNWRFNLNKRLTTVTGTFNTVGSTVTKVYSDGFEAVFNYDANTGQYVSTEGGGSHDRLTYDAANTEWTFNSGAVGRDEFYDAFGQLIRSQDVDGNITSYSYASNLLTQITDSSGQTVTLSYSGNNVSSIVTQSVGVNINLVRYGYDSSNRLTQVTVDLSPEDGDISDNNIWTTSYAYNGTSKRLSSIINGNGELVQFTYDASDRISRVIDASGTFTEYNYDNIDTTEVSADANPNVLTDQDSTYFLDNSVLANTDTETYGIDDSAVETALNVEYSVDAGGLEVTNSVPYTLNGQALSTVTEGSRSTDYNLDARRTTSLVIDPNELVPGTVRTGLAGAINDTFYYTIEVPPGATELSFLTSGGTGEMAMYVKQGAQPTTTA
ncbi:hypothetical protein MNBD_GAMMA12-1235, partial [hydrothermal vent metagenome]